MRDSNTPDGETVLKYMVDGLKGVSEGPWDHDETPSENDEGHYSSSKLMDSEGWTIADAINSNTADLQFDCPGDNLGEGEYVDVLAHENFKHLARCSPDNIQAIAAYVSTLKSERDSLQFDLSAKNHEVEIADATIDDLIADRNAALALVKQADIEHEETVKMMRELIAERDNEIACLMALKENGQ